MLLILFLIWVIVIISLFLLSKTLVHILFILGIGIILSIVTVVIFKILNKDKYIKKSSLNKNLHSKLNIYGKPLEKCSLNEELEASQMPDQTCSELNNGVHQICIKNIGLGNSFSGNTGQKNWSETRGSNNHCACIGAWANYTAKMGENNDKVLKCSAIPETALDPKYNTKWKKWNNVTIKNQDKYGLNELKKQCMVQAKDKLSQEYLTKLLSKVL